MSATIGLIAAGNAPDFPAASCSVALENARAASINAGAAGSISTRVVVQHRACPESSLRRLQLVVAELPASLVQPHPGAGSLPDALLGRLDLFCRGQHAVLVRRGITKMPSASPRSRSPGCTRALPILTVMLTASTWTRSLPVRIQRPRL